MKTISILAFIVVALAMTATPIRSGEVELDFLRHRQFVQMKLEEELRLLAEREEEEVRKKEIQVTATAYNSVVEQCDDDPWIAAWNDRLEPGMNVIAVSRDLEKLGLTRGVEVYIPELDTTFVVLDRMHHRWRNRIDIWMAEDIKAARSFGKKKLTVAWSEATIVSRI